MLGNGRALKRTAVVGGLFGLAALLLWAAWPDGSATRRATPVSVAESGPERTIEPPPATRFKELFVVSLAVSGLVHDDGSGIPEAQVCAECRQADCDGAPGTRRACATTDDAGRYHLAGLSPARYTVVADAEGFLAREYVGEAGKVIDLRSADSLSGVDFELEPGGVRISGTIRDQLGGVIAGARVTTRNDLSPMSAPVLSDANGHYELWIMAGEIGVYAEAEGYVPAHLPATAPGENLDLKLLPAAQIYGKVVVAGTEEPLADLPIADQAAWWSDSQVFSQADGSFVLSSLAPGRYRPTVISAGWYGQSEHSVEVGVHDTVGPVVINATPAVAVFGRVVVGEQRQPCAGAWVMLSGGTESVTRAATADEQGEVQIGSMLPGSYRVEVSCPGYVRGGRFPVVEVRDEDLHDLEWALEGGSGINGMVRTPQGEPAERQRVELTNVEGGRAYFVFSDASGKFAFQGQAEGSYEVFLTSTPDEKVAVDLVEGDPSPTVELIAPGAGIIRGRLTDERGLPVSEFGITLRYHERQLFFVFKSDDGLFAMEGMSPGSYRVEPTHKSSGDLEIIRPELEDGRLLVEVRPEETTWIDLQVEAMGNRISGQVVDADGDAVPDAVVTARRFADPPSGYQEDSALTDGAGRFTLDALPQGPFSLRAARAGVGVTTRPQVEVGEEVLLRLEPTTSLSGRVFFRGGGAPEHFVITVEGDHVERRESFTHTDGLWTVDGVPFGSVGVGVQAAKQRQLEFLSLTPGEPTAPLEIELEPLMTISGVVLDADTSEPVSRRYVRVRYPPDFTGANASTVTGEDGRFELAIPATAGASLVIYAGGDYQAPGPLPLPTEGDVELEPVRLVPRMTN